MLMMNTCAVTIEKIKKFFPSSTSEAQAITAVTLYALRDLKEYYKL